MPIAVAAVGLAAGIGAGIAQADAQRKAANKNIDFQEETNRLNYQHWLESRGAQGNALFPLYAPDDMEKQGLEDAIAYYNALGVNAPNDLLRHYQSILARQQPNIDAGDRLISDIFNRQLEREALAQQAPVAAARMGQAATMREGVDVARNVALNRMAAEERMKGYAGTGSYARNRVATSLVPFYQQAAGAEASAKLQNALDTQRIQEAQRQGRLASINMPVQRATQEISLAQAPATALANYANLQQGPLNFWKINWAPPPEQKAPSTPVVESPWGAALGAVSQGAGALAGAWQQQRGMNQAQANFNTQQQMAASQWNQYMDYLNRTAPGQPTYGPGF